MIGRMRGSMLLCLICSLFAVGCYLGDPVRTTSQVVRLRVVDSASGKPVAYESVSLKLDDQTPRPQRDEREVDDPWSHGVTNHDGQAEIEIEYTALDRSRESEPSADRDWITSWPYFVRVEKVPAPAEELNVLMLPGVTVKGKSFTVTVIRIQQPRYVETPGPDFSGQGIK
jgi:hypothetical protein